MHIVHVITRLIVGRAQENTLLSCEGQHDRGHRVTLITGPSTGPEGSLINRARSYGYEVIELDAMRRSILPTQDLSTYRHLRRLFSMLRPDVVHTHSSKAGIIGRYAAWDAGVPRVVHTIHGLSWTSSTRPAVNEIYKELERRSADRCHKIVCVADAMARLSLREGIGRADQYVTVHSGMDVQPFLHPPVPRDVTRQKLGLQPDDIVVGTIARLFDLKGHEDLIALAPQLCRANPRLKFMWVGDGSLRPMYERQIAAMGLSDRFVLTGLVPPGLVPELAAAMDILVHPSRREGLARALPQGSLAGAAVVAYDIDGNAEAIREGVSGYAVRPFDVRTLGERVRELAADDDKRRRFGEAGRAFCLDLFATQRMVDRLDEVYRTATPD